MTTIQNNPHTTSPFSLELSRQFSLALCLAGIALFMYLSNVRITAMGDSDPAALLPIVLLTERSFHFDSYEDHYKNDPYSYAFLHTKHGMISGYPMATGLLATPLYVVPVIWMEVFHHPTPDEWVKFARVMEKVSASIFTALSIVLFFHVCLALNATARSTLWLTLGYAFGSEAWSISSQALWMHGPGILFMLWSVLLAIKQITTPRFTTALLLGIVCGIVVAVRINNVLFVAPLFCWLFWKRSPSFFSTSLASLAIIIPLFIYNHVCYGKITGAYAADFGTPIFEGLTNVLFSPARGLLLYFPLGIFAICAIQRNRLHSRSQDSIALVFAVFIISAICLVSKWRAWHGGSCYGPRLLTEIQPFLLLIAIPFSNQVFSNQRFSWGKVAFIALFIWSASVQAVGAYCYPKGNWDNLPSRFELHPERGWDWSDNPVKRSVTASWQLWSSPMQPLTVWKADCRIEEAHLTLLRSQSHLVHVTVMNRGPVKWGRLYGYKSIYVGYKMFNAADGGISIGSNRGLLPVRLEPGDATEVNLPIEAPAQPGEYVAMISLVQDGVAWFSDKGTSAAELKLTVQ